MWERNGEVSGGGEGRCRGCEEVWGRCGRVYEVSVKIEGSGGKCVAMWGKVKKCVGGAYTLFYTSPTPSTLTRHPHTHPTPFPCTHLWTRLSTLFCTHLTRLSTLFHTHLTPPHTLSHFPTTLTLFPTPLPHTHLTPSPHLPQHFLTLPSNSQEIGPATRYTLRRNTASIMKI